MSIEFIVDIQNKVEKKGYSKKKTTEFRTFKSTIAIGFISRKTRFPSSHHHKARLGGQFSGHPGTYYLSTFDN